MSDCNTACTPEPITLSSKVDAQIKMMYSLIDNLHGAKITLIGPTPEDCDKEPCPAFDENSLAGKLYILSELVSKAYRLSNDVLSPLSITLGIQGPTRY